jgi:hypothetical protein
MNRVDGSSQPLSKELMLRPLEKALKTLRWAGPLLAISLMCVRFIH